MTRGRRETTTGGLLLWGGTASIGVSTVILLAILSRHFHRQGFSGLSTLFGLLFVASLIPSGIPLRAAALIVDGAQPLKMRPKQIALLVITGGVCCPLISYALHLPFLAVVFVIAQIIAAIPLAIRRGSLIATRRFSAMGANLFLEGAIRIIVGTLFGILWGMPGLAASIMVATTIAMVAVPVRPTPSLATPRPMTSMFHTWFALVLLGLLVQLDILLVPSGLSKTAATRYDLAAVPSKGVYLVLAAASTFIFPYVRVRAQSKTLVLATLATLGLGLVVTAVLLPLRRSISELLGQHIASPTLLVVLGVAMSIAGATGIILNGGIALGVARPWPPLMLGILSLIIVWLSKPTASVFAVAVLVSEAGTALLTMWFCFRKPQRARHARKGRLRVLSARILPTHVTPHPTWRSGQLQPRGLRRRAPRFAG